MPNRKRNNHYEKKIRNFLIKLALLLVIILGLFRLNAEKADDTQTTKTLENRFETVTRYNFIRDIAPLAVKAHQKYKILPSITLAQAALESDFGQSLLARKYHNLFGIKAYGDVPTVNLNTQEYENGKWITISGKFRVYASDADSVNGHSRLFANGTTWNPKQYAKVLAAKDYKTAAKALHTSGYATDPTYSDKIIQMIETYHLNQFDNK